MRVIWGLIGMATGTLIIWKTYVLVSFFGKTDWAEEHLRGGLGGTYFLYKLIGLGVVALSVAYMFRVF